MLAHDKANFLDDHQITEILTFSLKQKYLKFPKPSGLQ